MRKYRVSYEVRLGGHIDFEAENKEELKYQMSEVKYPESDYEFFEEDRDVEVELVERLVPELEVIVYDGGWHTPDGSTIELRRYDAASFWRNMPELDPGYLNHIFIESCFCILPGGDI